jgi:hypothetical protein
MPGTCAFAFAVISACPLLLMDITPLLGSVPGSGFLFGRGQARFGGGGATPKSLPFAAVRSARSLTGFDPGA